MRSIYFPKIIDQYYSIKYTDAIIIDYVLHLNLYIFIVFTLGRNSQRSLAAADL